MIRGRYAGAFRSGVAVLAIRWFTVHLRAAVAAYAAHTPLTEMHIRTQVFVLAKVFITNPAAVTGSAVARHGGGCVEQMAVDKATADRIRLADVAIAAGGMAIGAVVIEHLSQRGMVAGDAAGFKSSPITIQRAVQAVLAVSDDLGMAFATGRLGISAGITDYANMRRFLVRSLYTTMTVDAADMSMDRWYVVNGVHQDFFPWLQRSHFSPSTCPFTFLYNLLFRFGIVD
jgi:hypothetical protein